MSLKNKTKERLNKAFECSKSFLIFLANRIRGDTVLRVASSLSYTSLIALVPLFAIALAIFAAFPGFSGVREQVQSFLLSSLAPNIEVDISDYFNQFVGATAKLSTFGVVGIAITSILLLSTIENSLNFIFKVHKPRRFTTKVTLYWTIITLGPLLLGAAFSVRGFFSIPNLMPSELGWLEVLVGDLVPTFLTLLCLMAVYILVPNKKVGVLNSFWGALVSVLMFGILRKGFAFFVLKSATYKTLYGALAVLPVFLVWMYAAWAVVILGAVLTASLDEFQGKCEAHEKPALKNKKKIKKLLTNERK